MGDFESADARSRHCGRRHGKEPTHLARETPIEANSAQVDDDSEYRGKRDGDEENKPSHWTALPQRRPSIIQRSPLQATHSQELCRWLALHFDAAINQSSALVPKHSAGLGIALNVANERHRVHCRRWPHLAGRGKFPSRCVGRRARRPESTNRLAGLVPIRPVSAASGSIHESWLVPAHLELKEWVPHFD